MLVLENGNKYKLIYLDTNVINAIAKNTNNCGKNFLLKYVTGDYLFVTSVFNLYEMSKSKGESRKKIIEVFDILPLGIVYVFPQIIEFEKKSSICNKELLMFATGIKGLFNLQISSLLEKIDNDKIFESSLDSMNKNFIKEIECWKQQRKNINWIENYKFNLISSMNKTFKKCNNYFEIKELGKYYSLEVLAYIKNQFIYSSNKEIKINSVIDAYNTSFLPYVEEYITEKTVASWLEMAKSKMNYLADKKITIISSLYDII